MYGFMVWSNQNKFSALCNLQEMEKSFYTLNETTHCENWTGCLRVNMATSL